LLGLRRDMPALFDAADAFVLSSAWEGMPLAVGEAMAMEKPVVATDAGGARELIGDAGIIVPLKNADALANAMLSLMQKPAEVRQALGQAARSRISSQFNIETRADKWEALYQAIVEAQS
jgi:glycosyltransferase involved in cell wall biosynthesis